MTDLNSLKDQLLPPAREAAKNAYAPYSQLHFGAAALCRDGQVITGCNVENASYSLTQCAERNALGTAATMGIGPGEITAMLIYTPGEITHSPCGACRQVIMELLATDGLVIAVSGGGEPLSWAVSELLPDAFGLSAAELAHEG